MNTADGAGWTKDVFLDERMALHCPYPAGDTKLALQSDFIQLDCPENFRVFIANWSNVRRETIDCYHAFWRSNRGQGLHQPPRRVRNDRSPLRMKIRMSTKRAELQKCYAFKTETYYRVLFRI